MAMIYFLGTGSAFPSSERDNTSLLFSFDGKNILVDVSGNPSRRLKEINKPLHEIDVILLTHTHVDHMYGLPSLLWGMWLEKRTEPLTILTDYRNKHHLHNWLETILIYEWETQFDIHIKTFDGCKYDEVIVDDELHLFIFPAKHSVPTVGCEFVYEEKRIVYSSDTEINSHINEYDYINILIHEATFAQKRSKFHSSMEEVLTSYPLENMDKLIFVHLSENEPYDNVLTKFEENNKGRKNIQLAYDQMKIIL